MIKSILSIEWIHTRFSIQQNKRSNKTVALIHTCIHNHTTRKLFEHSTCYFMSGRFSIFELNWASFHSASLSPFIFSVPFYFRRLLIYKIWYKQMMREKMSVQYYTRSTMPRMGSRAYINLYNLSCIIYSIHIFSFGFIICVLIIFISSIYTVYSKIHEIYTRQQSHKFFQSNKIIWLPIGRMKHSHSKFNLFSRFTTSLIYPRDNKFHKLLVVFAQIFT